MVRILIIKLKSIKLFIIKNVKLEKHMDLIEMMVIKLLSDHKIKANRYIFGLPIKQYINFFIHIL